MSERHPFHAPADCDERCTCCASCYQASGLEICGRLCEHWRDNDPDVALEVDKHGEETR